MAPRPGVIRAVSILIAALLFVDLAALGLVDRPGDADEPTSVGTTDTSGQPDPTAAPTTVAPPPDDMRAVIDELVAFVEEERGLDFKEPVDVALLEDDDFRAKLLEEEADPEEIEKTKRVLVALGLIDEDLDLEETIDGLLGDAVAGFYDPETKELYVRGGDPTPYVRQVIAHELVHALQDQHFDLDRPELEDLDDEQELAFGTLVEGDAERVDTAYIESLPADERRAAEREENAQAAGGDMADVPFALLYSLAFPYLVGPDFTEALLDAGGQARLDTAFASPPKTSEHVLHPESFLAKEPALEVAPPGAEGELVDEGVMGEAGVYLLLAPLLGESRAAEAAEGWGGDRFVAWADGRRTCFRMRIVMDDPADRMELQSALKRWAAKQEDATIEGDAPLILTSCG